MNLFYELVEASDPTRLVEKVNQYLELGWQLQGGVAIAADAEWNYYVQAVVRNADPDQPRVDQ